MRRKPPEDVNRGDSHECWNSGRIRQGEHDETASEVDTRAALVLAATAVALAPTSVLADRDTVDRRDLHGVGDMGPSRRILRDGGPGNFSIEAQGIGRISGLGPMFLTVKKCSSDSDFTYAGTFKMTAGNGDTLNGTYAGTQSAGDENGFGPFQGTLTITGGTGRFRHARGGLTFTAVRDPGFGGRNPTDHERHGVLPGAREHGVSREALEGTDSRLQAPGPGGSLEKALPESP